MSTVNFIIKIYITAAMFKKLIEESAMSNRPVSPIRTQPLPFRSKKFDPLISPSGRSPFRTRQREQNDIRFLLEAQSSKVKTATPVKSRSPINDCQQKGNYFYKKISQPLPGERSPLKARPFNEVFQMNPRANYYKPEDSSRSYITEAEKENKKQNFQLFTMLVGEIKFNNEFSRHNSQAEPAPVKTAKPELSQFSELLRQKSPESKKATPLLMRAVSAGCPAEKEDSMLISNGMQSNRENLSVRVGAYKQTPIQETIKDNVGKQPTKEPIIVNFSLGMHSSKVKMVESVKPPPPQPLIIPVPQINQSGEADTLMDRVNESQEVDFSNMEDRLNMDPCL